MFLIEPRRPWPFQPVRAPAERRLIARGRYAGQTGIRTVTEEVEFVSSNAAAVEAPNEPGDRGKLLAVGSGTAEIRAIDPVSGVVSEPRIIRSLADLTRVEIPYHLEDRGPVVNVGGSAFLSAIGYFGDGPAPLRFDEFALISSDPTIVSAVNLQNYGIVSGVSPGLATVAARDLATGITSQGDDSVVVGVRGALQRLRLEPKSVLALAGQERYFTTFADYAGGVTEVVTRNVEYSTSDSAVAEPGPWWPGVSRVVAKGPGTAVISARAGYMGLSTSDTGDDATITVLKPLARIKITPPNAIRAPGRSYFYAAIGEDVDGNEINLTQEVEWTSSNPNVARALNEGDERSRIDMLAPGPTTISAVEPSSGMQSNDADLEVLGPLVRLLVTSELLVLQPGWEWQVTTNGEDAAGGVTNITQEVTYASSDPSVVAVTNEIGMKSRIIAIAPGTATISATDPISGLNSTDGGTDVTITVAAP